MLSANKKRPIIAVVDDDAFVCRMMQRLLRLLGMDADTFASGQEFIDRLAAMPLFAPDCVILDVHMPGLNGLTVQRHLSRSRPGTPVIFMTAADEAWIREQALAAGAAAFLSKPFDGDLLTGTLRGILKLPLPTSDQSKAVRDIASGT
jgi:FixJ family two-component response regulator